MQVDIRHTTRQIDGHVIVNRQVDRQDGHTDIRQANALRTTQQLADVQADIFNPSTNYQHSDSSSRVSTISGIAELCT